MMMLKQHTVIQQINPYLYNEHKNEIKRIDVSIDERLTMEYGKSILNKQLYRTLRYMYMTER